MNERSTNWTDAGSALDAIEQQSGGVFTIELLHRGMAEELRDRAEAGDEAIGAKLMAASDHLEQLEDVPPNARAPGCILCNARLGPQREPCIFAFVHARTEEAHQAMVSAICLSCANEFGHDYDRVRAAVMQSVKDTFGSFHLAPGSRRDA